MKPESVRDIEGSVASPAEERGGARKRSPRRKRVEKSEAIRESLLKAAVEVVGEIGYANASIALITQRAGVGQGTFYNYFGSRQEILDALLPSLGKDMLVHIKKGALGGHSFAELEERSFRGFFDFLDQTPSFFRILTESDVFAPQGNALHFETVSRQYIRFLRHSWHNGEFPAYQEDELETIAFILMSARAYLAKRYVVGDGGQTTLPDRVADTYMKLVRFGLEGVAPPPSEAVAGNKAAVKKRR